MTDLTVLMSFPTEAPYRIDQVTNNPGLMLSLAIGQLFLAGVLSLVKAPRIWWTTAGLQLITIAVFFTLASWGTSDIALPASATTSRLTPKRFCRNPLGSLWHR